MNGDIATGQMVLPPLTALLMAAIGWRYSALARVLAVVAGL